MARDDKHGQHGFDKHAVVPSPLSTDFEVAWIARSGVEAWGGQNHGLLVLLSDQRLEYDAVVFSAGYGPVYDEAELIDDEAELGSHDPAVVGLALGGDAMLLDNLALMNRMQQIDAVAARVMPSKLGAAGKRRVQSW